MTIKGPATEMFSTFLRAKPQNFCDNLTGFCSPTVLKQVLALSCYDEVIAKLGILSNFVAIDRGHRSYVRRIETKAR